MNYEPPIDDPIATGAVTSKAEEGEHAGYRCTMCGSEWIRYEHLDDKDCTEECDDPCSIRCCNEEDCGGGAEEYDDEYISETYDTLEEMYDE